MRLLQRTLMQCSLKKWVCLYDSVGCDFGYHFCFWPCSRWIGQSLHSIRFFKSSQKWTNGKDTLIALLQKSCMQTECQWACLTINCSSMCVIDRWCPKTLFWIISAAPHGLLYQWKQHQIEQSSQFLNQMSSFIYFPYYFDVWHQWQNFNAYMSNFDKNYCVSTFEALFLTKVCCFAFW